MPTNKDSDLIAINKNSINIMKKSQIKNNTNGHISITIPTTFVKILFSPLSNKITIPLSLDGGWRSGGLKPTHRDFQGHEVG